jgi:hypothetical protein
MSDFIYESSSLLDRKKISLNLFVDKMMDLENDFADAESRYLEKRDSPRRERSMQQALSRYWEFAIAAIDRTRGYRYSVQLDSRNTVNNDWIIKYGDSCKFRVDFDSLQGRSTNIPWRGPIEVFPLFGSGFPIQRNLHIGGREIMLDVMQTLFHSLSV